MRIGTVGTGFITNYILDNIEKTYTDYERMVSDDSLDFIYIASPNSLHYSQTKSALEHGKNVICEKPFTLNDHKHSTCILF